MSPLLEEMPGRAEESSRVDGSNISANFFFSGTPLLSQAYGLPAPLEEEPKCLLS